MPAGGLHPDADPKAYEGQCSGKEPHASETAARAAMGFYHRADRRKSDCLNPYRCPFCLQWHLGHPTPAYGPVPVP